MTLYVANVATNGPIDKATLKISTTENPAQVFEVQQLAPGIYELHTTFPANKAYMLNVQMVQPLGADLIGLKGVVVGEKLHTEASVSSVRARRLTAGCGLLEEYSLGHLSCGLSVAAAVAC